MAERRMFAKTIIDSDAFLDMPTSAQALYFHLSMRADDDGFINNPKKIQRMIGTADDDLKLLVAKRFLIPFDSGVVVIKHWKIHNYIRNDRYKPTIYQEEKNSLEIKENNAYTERLTSGIPTDNQMETQVRLGKDRLELGKVSLESGGGGDSSYSISRTREEEELLKTSLSTFCGKYFGRDATEYEQEQVREMIGSMHHVPGEPIPPFRFGDEENELLQIAFEAAAKAGSLNVGYIEGVFRNYWRRGIHTPDDYYDQEIKREVRS